ncbi:type II toxin-antitoxin system HicA family toxin [Patescibacteria group bacterium]|nr:type II toxin-antitoxin system HicA family toxin [Patescibacteria group bacterium]
MPKIPVVTVRKLIKVLKKCGFIHHRTRGSHQIYIHKIEKNTISVPVHQSQDLGKGITLSILKEAGISKDKFIKLV